RAVALHAARRGWAGVADRMRQCGESVTCARGVAAERDRRAVGAGREPLAIDPAVIDGKCAARRIGWNARRPVRALDQGWIAGRERLGAALARAETRLARARLYAGAFVADRNCFRDCARVARDEGGSGSGPQRQRPRFELHVAFAAEQIA